MIYLFTFFSLVSIVCHFSIVAHFFRESYSSIFSFPLLILFDTSIYLSFPNKFTFHFASFVDSPSSFISLFLLHVDHERFDTAVVSFAILLLEVNQLTSFLPIAFILARHSAEKNRLVLSVNSKELKEEEEEVNNNQSFY